MRQRESKSVVMSYVITVLVFFFAFLSVGISGSSLDIHLRLSQDSLNHVLQLSSRIHSLAPNDKIDFKHVDEPHVTLYLTEVINSLFFIILLLRSQLLIIIVFFFFFFSFLFSFVSFLKNI